MRTGGSGTESLRAPIWIVVLLLSSMALVVPEGLAYAEKQSLLARFEASIKGTKDVTSNFTQTRHSPLLDEPIVATGKLWIRIPGDVRMEFETPDPMTLLKRADTTWLYVPKLGQVQRYSVSGASIPIEWVLGSTVNDLRKRATVTAAEDHVVLTPAEGERTGWKRITIAFSETDRFPREFRIEEVSGEVVVIQLEKPRVNQGISSKRFVPEWPADAEIIRIGE